MWKQVLILVNLIVEQWVNVVLDKLDKDTDISYQTTDFCHCVKENAQAQGCIQDLHSFLWVHLRKKVKPWRVTVKCS